MQLLDLIIIDFFLKQSLQKLLIAMVNKLLKHCFAFAKSGRPHDEMYVHILPRYVEENTTKKFKESQMRISKSRIIGSQN